MNYPYIRAWAKLSRSDNYCVDDAVAQAKQQNAPEDVIFWNGRRWVVFADIKDRELQKKVKERAKYYQSLNQPEELYSCRMGDGEATHYCIVLAENDEDARRKFERQAGRLRFRIQYIFQVGTVSGLLDGSVVGVFSE